MTTAIISAAYKNNILDAITGKDTISANNRLGTNNATAIVYFSAYPSTDSPLNVAVGLASTDWTVPMDGVAAFAKTIEANADGPALWVNFTVGTGTFAGPVSLTGAGGMWIANATTWVSGTSYNVSGSLIFPLNNGATLRINQACANAFLNLLISGTANAFGNAATTIDVYDGTQPATADTAVGSQTKLFQYTGLSSATWASASGQVAALSGNIASGGNALATGTATWFRMTRGTSVMDGSCGTLTGDMRLASTTYTSGVAAPAITAFTLTLP